MNNSNAAALAAWESATVQTLNPLLSLEQADALWTAIVANRETPSADTFGTALLAVTAGASTRVLVASRSAIDSLTTLIPLLATAAPAAHAE